MIVALDANIVIYWIEANAAWFTKVDNRLAAIRAAGDSVAVCEAALLECLLQPLKAGDAVTEASFRAFFAAAWVQMLPVTTAVWERAARIGAANNFKGFDALHLAAAVEHGCGLFLTADARLGRCTDITVEVLK